MLSINQKKKKRERESVDRREDELAHSTRNEGSPTLLFLIHYYIGVIEPQCSLLLDIHKPKHKRKESVLSYQTFISYKIWQKC